MKVTRILAPIAAAAAFALAPSLSQASLVVYIQDMTTSAILATITDGGAGDTCAGTANLICFNQTFLGYSTVGSFGSVTDNPLNLHLNAGVGGFGGAGPISIFASYSGILSSAGQIFVDGGGSGAGSTSWQAYTDQTNKQFFESGSSPTLEYTHNGFGASSATINTALTNPFSATLRANFDYTGLNGSQFFGSSQDITMQIPEPTSIALAGLALIGLGAAARRRKA